MTEDKKQPEGIKELTQALLDLSKKAGFQFSDLRDAISRLERKYAWLSLTAALASLSVIMVAISIIIHLWNH